MSNPLAVRLRPVTMKPSDLSLHRIKMLREQDPLYLRGFRPLLTLLKAELIPLDHRLDQIRVPCVRSVNTVPYPAVDVILRMYCIDANSMSTGSTVAQPFPIRAVGLSSFSD